jgi:hypothetical protein
MAARPREPAAAAPSVGADGIPALARRRTATIRQTLAACAIGAAILALFASSDLPSWADQLRDGPMTPLLRKLAIGWNADLRRFDLNLPHGSLHRTVEWLKDLEWPQPAAPARTHRRHD